MEYISLYRKYRPLFFNDILGQNEIVLSLKNSLNFKRFSHAYIFSGPRGTGKTSLAKIFARSLNCLQLNSNQEACKTCLICIDNFNNKNLDIIEIDGASNNGVDEIRDLNKKIQILPTNSKYKIYIIDEVHMLSTSAFNALLKTLEEPPNHIIFILATTEISKIPITILSRCQRFNFSLLSDEIIIKNMQNILGNEKIKYEIDALKEISYLSSGSLRDSLSFLEQVISYKNYISAENVLLALRLLNNEDKNAFIDAFLESNEKKILILKNKIIDNNIDINYFLWNILKILKSRLEKLILSENNLENKNHENYFALFEFLIKYNSYSLNFKDTILNFELFILDLINYIRKHLVYDKKVTESFTFNKINDIIADADINKENITGTLLKAKTELMLKNNFDDNKFKAFTNNDYFLALYKTKNDIKFKTELLNLIKKITKIDFLYFYNSYNFPRVNKNGMIVVFENQTDVNYLNYSLFKENTRNEILKKLNLQKFCIFVLTKNSYENLVNNISLLKFNINKFNSNDYYNNIYDSNITTKNEALKVVFGEDIKII